MKVTLKIKRFNPEGDAKPHWETYALEVDPTDRLLYALHQVKWFHDGTLALRRSCAHGICGSDNMRINGRNRLACKVLMQDLASDGGYDHRGAMLALTVLKDLIVDMEPFLPTQSVMRTWSTSRAADGRERLQSPARAALDQGTKRILCAACTTSCRRSGGTAPMWARRRLCRPTALSLTTATARPSSGWKC
jgi:succinate dehydrogenase / fumarate reductase iron-sulfur subunit